MIELLGGNDILRESETNNIQNKGATERVQRLLKNKLSFEEFQQVAKKMKTWAQAVPMLQRDINQLR